jgi:hypothetical protein
VPIAASDIFFRLSGGGANTSPASSLGGTMSTAAGGVITSGVANNLWDDVSGAESAAGDIEYRCFYVQNSHGSITWRAPVIWIDTNTTSTFTTFDIALDPSRVQDVVQGTVADESTAPVTTTSAAITFSAPATKGAGLALSATPDLNPGSFRGVWIRRTVTAGAAAASDSGTLRAEGDSGP